MLQRDSWNSAPALRRTWTSLEGFSETVHVIIKSFSASQLVGLGSMAPSEFAWRSSVSLRHEIVLAQPQHPRIFLLLCPKCPTSENTPTHCRISSQHLHLSRDIQRVGRIGDCGKWIYMMSLYDAKAALAVSHPTTETIIYSSGVNNEPNFEAETLARMPNYRSIPRASPTRVLPSSSP